MGGRELSRPYCDTYSIAIISDKKWGYTYRKGISPQFMVESGYFKVND